MQEWGSNLAFAPVAFLIGWDGEIAFAIEAWRGGYGHALPRWIEKVGEFEALCALSGFAFENPEDPLPEIVEGIAHYEGEGLGHPLIERSRCVRNDVRLDHGRRLLVVSGSNMSGKSTLLRTVGTNAVLALCGAPVRADRLRISPVAVGASIHTLDSLQEGTSRFYAEITRLRLLMEIAERLPPLLFLIDEILDGTNSRDRRIGAEAVVQGYVERGAIGLITTHDLALTEIVGTSAFEALNVHFEDTIVDGRVVFDYRLLPGVGTRSNALALMRAVGLKV